MKKNESLKKYEVNFYNKTSFNSIHKEIVLIVSPLGAILKGKTQALINGFRFEKLKHVAFYKEL